MTTLRKPIFRRTAQPARVLYARPRQIVVGLLPGDVIEFREAGCRTRFVLSVETAFRYAVRLAAQAAAAGRVAARKAKKVEVAG